MKTMHYYINIHASIHVFLYYNVSQYNIFQLYYTEIHNNKGILLHIRSHIPIIHICYILLIMFEHD